MRVFGVLLGCVLATSSALAQSPAYVPPDRELWDQMVRALSDVSMTLTAHQQVQQIMANVLREAQVRDARNRAPQPLLPPESPK